MWLPERTTLITGTGRSGTSWLGKLLDASPTVAYRHEPDNRQQLPWFRAIPSRLDPVPENIKFRATFEVALDNALWTHCLHFIRPPDFPKQYLARTPWRLVNFTMRASRRLHLAKHFMLRIPRWTLRGDITQINYVLKSVDSNLRLAWINQYFPAMRLVLIIRHPGGYLSSWLRAARDHAWSGFGDRGRLDGTLLPFQCEEHQRLSGRYEHGSSFERELIYWIIANETPILGLGDSSALKVVVYEDLCSEPEKMLRAVYEFCGIPFCDSAKQFLQHSTSAHSDGFHSVFKDPSRTAGAWRQELDREQARTVESYLSESFLSRYWR